MRVLLSLLCVAVVLCGTPASGQTPAPAPQPKQAGLPPPPPVPPPPSRAVNIQLELTITDLMGANAPVKKSVTLIASDGTFGRIRSAANARPNDRTGVVAVELNIDARPTILQGESIRMECTIEYKPLSSVTGGDPSLMSPTSLNQNMNVILQNGKPLVVSQAADPISDRKIIVEARATVLK